MGTPRKDCPQVPAEKERPQVPAVELRWNRDCLVPERAILVRISPQLIQRALRLGVQEMVGVAPSRASLMVAAMPASKLFSLTVSVL